MTNNESTRSRNIDIRGRSFIIRKSRCEINKDNYKAYRILELFSNKNYISDIKPIKKYIKENKISKRDLLELAKKFPAKTLKNMLNFGII